MYMLIMGGGAVGSFLRCVASTAIMARLGTRFSAGSR
jgi:fluoride ion exporter CrcB/FEX